MINPGNQDFIDSTGISADSTKSYTLKAVTSRGNIATFSVSPDASTQVQLVIPAEVQPGEEFRVVTLITNNSTQPNNIANLVPIIKNNSTLTQIDGPLPPSIKSLPQGNTATFTSTYQAPETIGPILFNATYTGAPASALVNSNMTVALSSESEEATNSQWSQAATRVGILISGIPNPVDTEGGNSNYLGKWGIGIINPLDRDVEVYSVGILGLNSAVFQVDGANPVAVEPLDGWRFVDVGTGQNMITWENATNPRIIPAKSVQQFRVETDFDVGASAEVATVIQALTSEGKLSVMYTISAVDIGPMVNAYYSTDATNSTTAKNTWTYLVEGIPSAKNDQIFNATVENSRDDEDLDSDVKMIILVPSDFTDIKEYGSNTDWDTASIEENPDGSHIISVETAFGTLFGAQAKTFQFSADAPVVNDDKLYVMQTTTIYPGYSGLKLASALSEAGIEVVP
jgi:hypothetical protein